jgi:DNA-binding NarL/FixJ family response regulator
VVFPARVLVVDDHAIVRDGISAVLEQHPNLKVIGAVGTGREAVAAAVQLTPDVVVMDLMLPELNGVDATQRILTLLPGTHVVVLSVCHTSEHVFRALRAGARGYVVKEGVSADLVRAVLAVIAGDRFLSPQITELVIAAVLSNSEVLSPLERLSKREREVLHMTVAGGSSAAIAQRLSLSRKTVDTYRSRIMGKLGVADLTGLIHFAIEHAMAPL